MKKKLRIGVLTDGDKITAWSYKMLQLINNSEHSEIVLIVKKQQSSANNQSLFNKIWNIRKDFFWILYNKIENKLFKPTPDAFQEKCIKEITNCDEIVVKPRETKFSDYISPEDVEKIKTQNIDVFVRLGFRILRGGILKASKYGIWSFHHGDNSVNRGGPAGAWEVLENWDTTGVILQILSENLDGGTILSTSFSATDKVSIKRNKNNYYWKALSMLPRKLSQLYTQGEEEFFNSIEQQNTTTDFYYNRLFVNPTNAQAITAFIRIYSKKIKHSIKSIFYFDQWILLYQFNKKSAWSKSFFRFTRLVPPKDRFWADPFVYEKDDNYFIFIEELIYKENKGKISVMEIDAKGNYTQPKTILEKDYHLSYPFIFDDNDSLYMIPETSGNNTVELYKCVDFPLKWELSKVLLNNLKAVDSTILKYNNKYWLFCNIKENEGASSLDELFLFYSDKLEDNWISHPCNPIVSDVSQSRPAGRIFKENGKLYRPSQDSSKCYGYGMKINEIIELSETTYKEITIQSIHPNWAKDLLSTHTINKAGKLTVIDALVKRRK